MSFRRLMAVARKEFIHILRDPRSLGMAIAMPAMMLVLFGYALTLDVDRVPMAVWDQSRTPASRDLLAHFTGGRYFALQSLAGGYKDLERAIDSSQALVALVIPSDFADRVESGRAVQAQLIVDGSDSNTATIAMGYAEAVAAMYNRDLQVTRIFRTGRKMPTPPVDLRPRVWFNTDLESKNFIIPGLIAVIMMVISALLTSLTVAREWERGTMEQLISTPVRGVELIVGKLVPYFVVGLVDVTLAVGMGQYVFDVPLRGSVPLLLGMASIFLVGAMSLGILISTLVRNQLLASQLAIITTFVPSYLLSGFLFSIANMPVAIRWVTFLIPARYFIAILKGIYLKGIGLEILGLQAVLLAAFSVAAASAAVLKFKKKL